MSIRGVAFDFDGVIVDSMTLQEQVWEEALALVVSSIDTASSDQLKSNLWAGCAGSRIFMNVAISDEQRQMARTEKDRLWERKKLEVVLFPGAKRAIETLRTRVPLFVATTAKRNYVEEILERNDLVDQFSIIITDADVASPKPAPEMLLTGTSSLDIFPTELLYIGDSITDYEMAEAAGSDFLLLVVHGRTDPKLGLASSAASWEEVLDIALAKIAGAQK